ncbi:hypothetical protein [Actinoplanes sp. NPDC089786]|uniref:hypothetical protein n=1 Tax=Actinoplanes sp. NPDC089786 TaxID=3155185 RepID=UPI0034346390
MTDSEISIERLLIVEYERLKEEQKSRIGFRDNLIYATLGSMAAVIAATLSSKGHANLLLLLPAVSTVLGWTYLVNDEKVSAIGTYIRETLHPRFAAHHDGVFGWEKAHRGDRFRRSRKVLQLVVDLGTFCVSALAALIVYWVNGPWSWIFLSVSVLELLVVALLAVQMIRYADLGVEPAAPVADKTPETLESQS